MPYNYGEAKAMAREVAKKESRLTLGLVSMHLGIIGEEALEFIQRLERDGLVTKKPTQEGVPLEFCTWLPTAKFLKRGR